MKTEKILADAEVAACYLRALLDKGIPMKAAVDLTCSYVCAYLFSKGANEEPKPPWEQGS